MKNILITGIGGPTPRSIAKTIRKTRPGCRIIGMDANPKAIGFFMPGLIDKAFLAPRMDDPGYRDFVRNLVESESIELAFVQPEVEVIGWGRHLKEEGNLPCPVLIPPMELSVALNNKAIMSDVLEGTGYIPRTIRVNRDQPRLEEVKNSIGFPCWIRATTGAGGFGSLKITDVSCYESWLFIHGHIPEFTVSEFLPGRHLATQMLYYEGSYLKGASLECVEYVMASVAPSGVTGNTSFGRLLNEDRILSFCDECLRYICGKMDLEPHGVFSFDLKEDERGRLKVTEINIRHMAYTGVMAEAGFDLVGDTITLLTEGQHHSITPEPFFRFEKPYVFLRDVDTEPVILDGEDHFPG